MCSFICLAVSARATHPSSVPVGDANVLTPHRTLPPECLIHSLASLNIYSYTKVPGEYKCKHYQTGNENDFRKSNEASEAAPTCSSKAKYLKSLIVNFNFHLRVATEAQEQITCSTAEISQQGFSWRGNGAEPSEWQEAQFTARSLAWTTNKQNKIFTLAQFAMNQTIRHLWGGLTNLH